MAGETGRKSNGIGGEGIEGDKQEGTGSSKGKKKAKLSKERVMYIPISADKDKGRHTGSDIKRSRRIMWRQKKERLQGNQRRREKEGETGRVTRKERQREKLERFSSE